MQKMRRIVFYIHLTAFLIVGETNLFYFNFFVAPPSPIFIDFQLLLFIKIIKLSNVLQNLIMDSSKEVLQERAVQGNTPYGIDICFKNITFSVKTKNLKQHKILPFFHKKIKKDILKNVSGIFKSGRCSAIMGSSGAGKTTLLNILACRIDLQQNGKIYANNLEYNFKKFGNFANYVMQSDILAEILTVRQTLEFAFKLKKNVDQDQRKQLAMTLASDLKLEKCLDSKVGGLHIKGISGGEKKRVSIAIELISDPQVLVLDEPTSGLDSFTSFFIVSHLKKLAIQRNKTIIMSIHQPNSETFSKIDDLVLLVEGTIVYQGQASKSISYFCENFNFPTPRYTNPADFIIAKTHYSIQQNQQNYPNVLQKYSLKLQPEISNSINQRKTSPIIQRIRQTSIKTILFALLYRNFLTIIRHPLMLRAKILQRPIVALFIGGVFWGTGKNSYTEKNNFIAIQGFCFFLTITGVVAVITPVVLIFPQERRLIMKEENAKMYRIWHYFIAKTLSQLPEIAIVPFLTIPIYYAMVYLSGSVQQIFYHFVIYYLVGLAGTSIGMFIGSMVEDEKTVIPLVLLVCWPMWIFAGYMKNRQDYPAWIGWYEYLSPNKYGFQSWLQNETKNRQSLIDNLHFDITIWQSILCLIGLSILFRVLTLALLYLKRKRNQ